MVTTSRLSSLVTLHPLATAVTLIALATLPPGGNRALGQAPNRAAAASTLRAYPCRAADAENIAARLRDAYRSVAGLQIAADARAGQIIVDAPAEVQAGIAQYLAASPPPAAPVTRPAQPNAPVTRTQPSLQPQQPVKSRTVPFWHASPRDVELGLTNMLTDRLQAIPSTVAGERTYRLSLPRGGGLDLTISYTNNRVVMQGPGQAVDAAVRLVQALDTAPNAGGQATRMMMLKSAKPASVQRAMDAVRLATGPQQSIGSLKAMLFQPANEAPSTQVPPAEALPGANGDAAAATPAAANGNAAAATGQRALIGPVQIEILDGLDGVIVKGLPRDVDQVIAFLEQIDAISAETEPAIEVYPLRHVDSESLTALITPLYEAIYLPRQGTVSITALVKPNSLLLIGRQENVQTVKNLIRRLDLPVPPQSQFRVFRLRYAAAATAQATVIEFFANRVGLATKALVTIDYRSNALIVRASPRDMAEVARLILQIDTDGGSLAVNELRIFKLANSLASDLAPILQSAITGQTTGAGQQNAEQKSTMLQLLTVDPKSGRRLKSGILTDVRVTADARSNALLVSASAQSMELIAALIAELDQLPSVEAQIKVFTIIDGDSLALVEMLESLFGDQAAASGQPAVRTGAREGESSLVSMRFAVDTRTNSIIATGSGGDLQVVEAILLRLDESEARRRESVVYRLRNAPANDVALAINDFLSSERAVQQISPGMLSPFEQIEREVVVVAEPVTNSLLISATPRFFDEIKTLIEELDQRPPMVMIQVLIAEVALGDTDEFGVELGLQDSILFDRSLLGDIITTVQSSATPGTGVVIENEVIQSATSTPGYHFNNQPLGASSGAQAASGNVGSQGMSSFGVGRINNELGYGGFVFAASSESVSVLIRALKDSRRLDVLARPQIMTLDNQPALIHVGQRVPYLSGTRTTETGQQINDIEWENVGIVLGVTPRISPDGLVVMEIDADKSKVGPESEGIAVSISAISGEVIRSPRIDRALAQTTVSVMDGQTIVLGGMITTEKQSINRKVPGLGDFPLIGDLFRYDATVEKRAELLIIMTPHIIKDQKDAERVKLAEAARMHWCLADVVKLHGDGGLRSRGDEWFDSETPVIYPDVDPSGRSIQGPTIAPPETPKPPTPGSEHVEPSPFRMEFPPAPQGATEHSMPVPPPAPAESRPLRTPAVPVQPEATSGALQFKMRSIEPTARPAQAPRGQIEPAVYQQPNHPRPGSVGMPQALPGPVVPLTYQSGSLYRTPQHQAPPYQAPPYQAPQYQPPQYQPPQHQARPQQLPQYQAPPHQAPAGQPPQPWQQAAPPQQRRSIVEPARYHPSVVAEPTNARMPLYR